MRNTFIPILAAALFVLAAPVQADDRAVVEAFYAKLLSDPNAADLDTKVRDVVVEDWGPRAAARAPRVSPTHYASSGPESRT